MNIGLYIYDQLSTDSALTDLLGGVNIFPVQIAQDQAYPAITYSTINKLPKNTKDGVLNQEETRIQVDVFAKKYSDLVDLSGRVREILDGKGGVLADIIVEYCRFVDVAEFYNDDRELYHHALDFNLRHGATGTAYTPVPVGPGVTPAASIQKEAAQTGSSFVVTVGTLPAIDIDELLMIYRGGRLMIHNIDFTIDDQNTTIYWTLKNLGEDVILYLYE